MDDEKGEFTMKILIAPDSYKECLSAMRVAECIAKGLQASIPDAEVILRPMADGGEGTVDALIYGLKGKKEEIHTVDMYRRPLTTYYGKLDDTTAVIEVANIIGMEVTRTRNPYLASSFGVGDVIRQLIERGYKKVFIGLGGSLTNDGGAGLLEALGLQFIDNKGRILTINGGNLSEIRLIKGHLIPALKEIELHLICDVTNPLTGEHGATYTYGKQKGIEEEEMKAFEESIASFAVKLEQHLNVHCHHIEGAGAAGGIGYGLLSAGAVMHNGAEYIADIVLNDLDLKIFDYIFTGEGKSDFQTQYGKLPVCVANRGNDVGVQSILVSGGLGSNYEALYDHFLSLHSITDGPMSLDDAMDNAERLISNTCRNIGRLLK